MSTSEERRELMISDAVITKMKIPPEQPETDEWFRPIKLYMDEIIASTDNREKIVMKWIKSAEKLHATEVKDMILKIYNT